MSAESRTTARVFSPIASISAEFSVDLCFRNGLKQRHPFFTVDDKIKSRAANKTIVDSNDSSNDVYAETSIVHAMSKQTNVFFTDDDE